MKNYRLFGKWLLAATVFAAVAFQPATALAAGVIKLHEGDWTGNLIDLKLVEIILEEHMDYKTKTIFLPAGPAVFEAILAGEIDVAFEFWPSYNPTKNVFFEKWGGDGTLDYISEVGIVGETGWYVPRYVVEGDSERGIVATAPGLKTWEDLNQYKQVFAAPETSPNGRLVACPVAAWQCGDAARVENLKLDYVAVELGSETAHWAELEAAYKRGEPILVYSWEPHWTHAKFDLVKIDLPEHDEANLLASAWPQDIPFTFGSTTLQERHPQAYQMIKTMRLTNEQQAGMILDVDVNGVKIDDAVRKWMDANKDVWMAWIPQ